MRTRLAAVLIVFAALLPAGAVARADSAVTAKTKVMKVGKQRVGYRSFGNGRPLVLIMGLGGTMDAWDPTFLDALAAQGHRVVVFDNEGVGKTAGLRGKLTIARMADTTAGVIKALRLRRPDVAGWSMGGIIAQSFAVRHPRALRRLVLMATAPGDGRGTAPLPDALDLLLHGGNVAGLLGLLFPSDQTAARDAYISHITMRKAYAPMAPPAQAAKQTAASSLWMTGQDPDGKRVAQLKVRTLVGGGELDHILPVANQQHLAQIIRGAQLVTYPDAAHGFLFQQQDDFVPKLAAFLRAA